MAATEQAHLDQEITKQILSLCDLRSRRNTFSLISRLPREILAAIFICCASEDYCGREGYLTKNAPSWVNVSYVCHYWRTVALDCSTLWSYLFITSPRWTEELLVRSQPASLKISIAFNYEQHQRLSYFLGQALEHLERLQELCLDLSSSKYEDLIFPGLSSRAPRLQNLKVRARNYSLNPKRWVLFNGDAPSLDTLELTECSVLCHSFKLSGLTTLILCNIPAQLQQTTMEFLTMLSSMQDLTQLYLHCSLASATDFLSTTEFYSFQKISLSHLSRLLISAPLSTVVAFLACVNVPSEAQVGLDCNPEDGSDISYSPVLLFLAQRMSSTPRFRSLFIDTPGFYSGYTLSTSERDYGEFYPRSHQDWDSGTQLKVRICVKSSEMSSGNCICILSDISRFVPLADVESVQVRSPQPSSDFWREMTECLPNLRYIKLRSGFMPNLESVLSGGAHGAHQGAESQGGQCMENRPDLVLAPALEELEIHYVTFTGWPKLPYYAHHMDLQSLFDVLATRKAPGRLTMNHCTEGGKVHPTPFDVNGLWEGGCFHVVNKRDSFL